jgi:hypothetical protein
VTETDETALQYREEDKKMAEVGTLGSINME